MSAQGKELVNYRGGTYTFTTSEPHMWQYAIEILGTTSKESRDYLSFLEDMGIETVSISAGRAYLRKKDDGTPFVLHSDLKSRLVQAQKADFWPRIIISQLFFVLVFLCKWNSYSTGIFCRFRYYHWDKHCIHNCCGY